VNDQLHTAAALLPRTVPAWVLSAHLYLHNLVFQHADGNVVPKEVTENAENTWGVKISNFNG
jgi:hypothetical protein